jgi:hypothetical protein
MTPESIAAILVALILVAAIGFLVWKRQRDAARLQAERKSAEARAWAIQRITDFEARGFEPLPGPDANHDPGLAALRERFVQSIEDGDEDVSFYGSGR